MIEIIGELFRGRDVDPSFHNEATWVADTRRYTIGNLVHWTGVVRHMEDQKLAIATAEAEHRQASIGAVAATTVEQPDQATEVAPVYDITTGLALSAEEVQRIGVADRPPLPETQEGLPNLEEIRANVKAA